MQARAHFIDPIDAVTCSTFDVRQRKLERQNLFEKSTVNPTCLTVCLSLHQGVAQLRKNQAKALTEQYKLEYDLRARVDHGLSPQL
jgi:hypothetical protein